MVEMRRGQYDTGVDLANQIRGVLKPFGLIAGKGGGQPFMERVRALVADGPLQNVADALLSAWQAISTQINALRRLVAMARQNQTVRRLMTMPGVGALVALTFTCVIVLQNGSPNLRALVLISA